MYLSWPTEFGLKDSILIGKQRRKKIFTNKSSTQSSQPKHQSHWPAKTLLTWLYSIHLPTKTTVKLANQDYTKIGQLRLHSEWPIKPLLRFASQDSTQIG